MIYRIAGAFKRRAARHHQWFRDKLRPSYGRSHATGRDFRYRSGLPGLEIPVSPPSRILAMSLDHCFDLLGSGPVATGRPDKPGIGVSSPNRLIRDSVRDLIPEGPWAARDYRFIDWRRDFRSGRRWSAETYWDRVTVVPGNGADIKIPWELGRLQHLPPAAALAVREDANEDKEKQGRLVAEIRAQILDFIASNPPRFGVHWRTPMEQGLRVVSITLALDILHDAGITLDQEFIAVVTASLDDHARHILRHLEWSETARGNHYLGNILGILFAASHLPETPETLAWQAFAVEQMQVEILRQFRTDGGGFEASTGYHRLSLEMMLLAAALADLFDDAETRRISTADRRGLGLRVPQDGQALPRHENGSLIGSDAINRLIHAGAFLEAVTKPSGLLHQVGDMDSGSAVKFVWPRDDRETAQTLALYRRWRKDRPGVRRPVEDVGERRTLDQSRETILTLPGDHRRVTGVSLPDGLAALELSGAFPRFGLFILGNDRMYLALRAYDPALAGEWGHGHDDNLAVELEIDGKPLITDPGAFVYGADADMRNRYRHARAHFAPRPQNILSPVENAPLFELAQTAKGRCLYAGPAGIAAVLSDNDWTVMRTVHREADRLVILDGCLERPLAPASADWRDLKVAEGYGRQGAHPVCCF